MQQKHRVARTVYPPSGLPRTSAKILPHPTLYGRQEMRTEFRSMPDGAAQLLRINSENQVIERLLVYSSQIEQLIAFLTEPLSSGILYLLSGIARIPAKILPHPALYGRRHMRTEFREMPDHAVQLQRYNSENQVIERILIYPSQIEQLIAFLTEPPTFGLAVL